MDDPILDYSKVEYMLTRMLGKSIHSAQYAALLKLLLDARGRAGVATEARKQYGVEAAQILLGHATLSATQIYAEKNAATAMKIVGEIG